jgi:hypothetical protein
MYHHTWPGFTVLKEEEAQILGRIIVQGQHREKVHETPISTNKNQVQWQSSVIPATWKHK